MSKSEKAFRNISEVSDWLETPTHVLRFWESKFSQIKPTKRAGGRRYYRPKDMLLIGGIKQLLHIEGHTIKGAKQVLREKGLNYVVGLSKPIISEEYVKAVNVEKANEEVTKTNAKSHNENQTSLFELFPNPSESNTNLKFEGTGNYNIIVLDLNGKSVIQINLEQVSEHSLNISSLNKGVYFVKVSNQNNLVSTKKLIKK